MNWSKSDVLECYEQLMTLITIWQFLFWLQFDQLGSNSSVQNSITEIKSIQWVILEPYGSFLWTAFS